MNGAGTGMVAYQVARQVQARRRTLVAVYAVVLGTAPFTASGLPPGTATPRSTSAASMASALFAMPTSIG